MHRVFMSQTVVISKVFKEPDIQRMMQTAPEFNYLVGETRENVREADVILGIPDPAFLCDAKKLKWLQINWAGTDAYTKNNCLGENVVLTNATGAFGPAMSEHMLAAALALMKRLHLYRDNMAEHIWQERDESVMFDGAVVLTVGLGDIGGCFAMKAKALGAYNIVVRHTKLDKPDWVDEIFLDEDLDKLIPRADIVALSMPNTDITKGMFDRRRIGLMKKDAILINVGRGNAVDTVALAEALNGKNIAGASIDVSDPEPLVPDHPLWGCENALITPHISGLSKMKKTYERIVDIFVENLRRYSNGQPLMNVVDLQSGYVKNKGR